MKKIFGLLISATIAFLLAAVIAYAYPGGATATTPSDKGDYPEPSPGTVNVVSGHIYQSNLSTEQPTYHWAGIYGNVSGKLVLGDSNSKKMFEWDANATYVFFKNSSTINWGSLSNASCTDVENAFNFLNATGVSDDCEHTLTTTRDPGFKSFPDIGSTVAGQTYDNSTALYWWTLAVKDGSDIVFAGEVVPAHHAAYNGDSAMYQVILPENGNNGDTTATTYYVWVELY